jgi:biotin carboxyl carrier protein
MQDLYGGAGVGLQGTEQSDMTNPSGPRNLVLTTGGVPVSLSSPRSLAVAVAVPLIAAKVQLPQHEPATPKPGLSVKAQLVAPMPGVIQICEKNPGDPVQKGDVVLILEAMKMENLITSPVPGKVVSILCKEGSRVSRGEVLALIA